MSEVSALKVSLGLDSANFTKSVSDINRKLRAVNSEFSAASAGVDGFGGNLDELKTKSDNLSRKFTLQSEKVKTLKDRYEELAEAHGKDSKQAENALIQYNKAVGQMKKTESQLDKVNGEIKEQSRSWNKLGGNLDSIKGKLSKVGNGLKTVGKVGVGAVAALGGALAGVGGAIGKVGIEYNAMLEQSEVAWTTLLGTQGEAKNMLKDISDFTKATPFETEQVDMMAKYLHNAGLEGEKLFDELLKVSDVSSAFAIPASEAKELTRQMSQVRQAGVAYTEDLNVLQDRGIPIFQAIAEQMGIQVRDVKEMASEGKVSSEIYLAAFDSIASGVEGASEAQSKTFSGMMSTFKDTWKIFAGELSKPVFDKITEVMPIIIDKVNDLNEAFTNNGWSGLMKEILPDGVVDGLITGFNFIKDTFNTVKDSFVSNKDNIVTVFQNIYETGTTIFTELSSYIKPILSDVVTFIREQLAKVKAFWDENGEQIVQAVKKMWELLKPVFEVAFSIIKETIENVKGVISGALDIILGLVKTFSSLLTGDWKGLWEGIKQTLSGVLEGVWNLLQITLLGKAVKLFKTFGGKALDMLTTPFKKAKDFIKETVDKIVGFFTNLGSKLKINIPKPKLPHFKLNGKFDLIPPDISVPKLSIDWYKTGGLALPNSPQIIGIGDHPTAQEAILPLTDKVLGTIANGISKFIPNQNNQQNNTDQRITYELVLNVDGYETARSIVDHLDLIEGGRMSMTNRRMGVK